MEKTIALGNKEDEGVNIMKVDAVSSASLAASSMNTIFESKEKVESIVNAIYTIEKTSEHNVTTSKQCAQSSEELKGQSDDLQIKIYSFETA